jgi:Holliday junction DNA helicase RuvA
VIAHLAGTILESAYDLCIIDVNGVGYEVAIPLSTFDKLPLPGNKTELFIHTQVREDAITLFGFATKEEKALFKALINVSGVGGKLALSVLSDMPVANFCNAIAANDSKSLARISGIGKRTAERLIVELKGKLDSTITGVVTTSVAGAGATAAASGTNANYQAFADAAEALEKLGFKSDAVSKVLNALATELPPEKHTSEELLRAGLMRLQF